MDKTTPLYFNKKYAKRGFMKLNNPQTNSSITSLESIVLERKSFHYLDIKNVSVYESEEKSEEFSMNEEIILKLENIYLEIGQVINEIHGTFPDVIQMQNMGEIIEESNVDGVCQLAEENKEVEVTTKMTKELISPPQETQFQVFTACNDTPFVKQNSSVRFAGDTHESVVLDSEQSSVSVSDKSSIPSIHTKLSLNENKSLLSSCESAKNLLKKCMKELNEIRLFLEKTEVRRKHCSKGSIGEAEKHQCIVVEEQDTINVTVDETSPNGKLIISIAGQDGERENIQLIMKKCPECEKYDNNSSGENPKYEDSFTEAKAKASLQPHELNYKCIRSYCDITKEEPQEIPNPDKRIEPTLYESALDGSDKSKTSSSTDILRPQQDEDKRCDNRCKEFKSPQSSTKKRSCFRKHKTVEETRKKQSQNNDFNKSPKDSIKVEFDPNNPKESIVKGANHKDMPIILNETVNMSFISNTGEEYIFSIKVAPKNDKQLRNNSLKEPIRRPGDSRVQIYRMEVFPNLLPRLKVCPSKDINIATLPTKLRTNGIKHRNSDVETILKELGVDELLKASRPVICGRVAFLDERTVNRLPYSASLESLPLEVEDTDIIKQSLGIINENDEIKFARKFSVFSL